VTIGESFPTVLEAARTGAEWAWSRLYKDLSPSMLGYLRAKKCPDAEDVLGEAFLDIVRNLERFNGGEREFRAWALTICHRRLVDRLRKSSSSVVVGVPLPDEDAGPTGDVEQDAFALLGSMRVRELVGRLSPDQQDVVLLRIIGDMTVEEVAAAMGKRPGAVKALQRRALANLRKEISKEGVPL
jgi:RNA polymerase sigma-70 factor (ECF subfamily)